MEKETVSILNMLSISCCVQSNIVYRYCQPSVVSQETCWWSRSICYKNLLKHVFSAFLVMFRDKLLISKIACSKVAWQLYIQLQSTLDISNSDISNSAKIEASIWIKNTLWLLSRTKIWRWMLFYKSKLPEVALRVIWTCKRELGVPRNTCVTCPRSFIKLE